MKKTAVRMMMLVMLIGTMMFSVACQSSPKAREQALSGEQTHERHAEGIDSQVSDN